MTRPGASRAQQAKAKNGRFGNAKVGTVTPGRIIPARAAPPSELATTPTDLGPVDKATLRYGTVVGNPLLFTASPAITDPTDTWPSLDLPGVFEHGGELPECPTGFGYVRLGAGSVQVGSSAWDADTEDAAFARPTSLPAERASIIRIHVRSDDHRVIWIWLSEPYSGAPPPDFGGLQIASTGSASTLGFYSYVATGYSNAIGIRLNREITYGETVYLTVPDGFVVDTNKKDLFGSTDYPVSFPDAKHCYAKVVNRFCGVDLAVGDQVLINGGQLYFDNASPTKDVRAVFDCLPLGNVGEDASDSYGHVIGGNGIPISGTTPANYVYSERLALMKTIARTADPAEPVDWSVFTLPVDFEHGDPFVFRTGAVVTPLPDSIGYVRLARGSGDVGGKSWNADIASYGSDAADSLAPLTVAKCQIKNGNKLYVWFSQPVTPAFTTLALPATWTGYFAFSDAAVSVTGYSGIGPEPQVLVYNLTATSNPIDWDSMEQPITIAIQPGIAYATTNAALTSQPVTAAEIVFGSARDCYVLAWNIAGKRTLIRNDFVRFTGDSIIVEDTLNVSRTVYAVTTSDGVGFGVHRHLEETEGFSGGGIAFGAIPPINLAALSSLGVRTTE